ncbi:MAG: type II toxin-antitoxin system Phd/YefM family antitoxin [Limisphaerales bacterium]
MKKATVRDLRNSFPRIAAWVEEGEAVEITRAGKPFAQLIPLRAKKAKKFKMPDIAARLRRTYGDKVYDSVDTAHGIAASRGDS